MRIYRPNQCFVFANLIWFAKDNLNNLRVVQTIPASVSVISRFPRMKRGVRPLLPILKLTRADQCEAFQPCLWCCRYVLASKRVIIISSVPNHAKTNESPLNWHFTSLSFARMLLSTGSILRPDLRNRCGSIRAFSLNRNEKIPVTLHWSYLMQWLV